MKKYLSLASAIALAVTFTACNNDNEPGYDFDQVYGNDLQDKYFTVQDAQYQEGNMPNSTSTITLNPEMSDQVMNGAMNYINVTTTKEVAKFYLGIKDVKGYLIYVPKNKSRAEEFKYTIPVMFSNNYSEDCTLVISAEYEDGTVTPPAEQPLNYLDTQSGAIEVKLAFSNEKDVDLHLILPDGNHIYFGNPGGEYYESFDEYDDDDDDIYDNSYDYFSRADEDDDDEDDEDAPTGPVYEFGLDVDSNAGCDIDGINKENIYIPEPFVQNGVYTVIVDMYENCEPEIPTEWSIVVRYKGQIIRPTSGSNPVQGVYQVNAPDGDLTQVMTFTITDAQRSRSNLKRNWKFIPTPLTDAAIKKMERYLR